MEVVIESSGTKTTKQPKAPVVEESPPVRKEASRRVTIEDVEDSEDERDDVPSRKVADELPFRNVHPLEERMSAPTLPRKPGEPVSAMREPGKRKKRTAKNTENEDMAMDRILGDIRNTRVLALLGDLIDSHPKLARVLGTDATKTRRVNFVKTTEGDVRAAKVSNFSVAQVEFDEGDVSSEEQIRLDGYGNNVRVEPTDLTIMDSKGYAFRMLMFDTFPEIVTTTGHELAEGSIIIGDPVLQYFESLGPTEPAMDIKLATAPLSGKLRCLFPFIKGIRVEAISDCGSQIVSMSLATALRLGLDWDTRMTILMQVANEQVQKTLGLARNVPFRFGTVTLYLQVHILKAAPYDVLLGRPFEMLAETVVVNKRNGDVSVTLTDPYTGTQSTMPTYPRGFDPEAVESNASTNGSTSGGKVPKDF